MEEGDGGAAAAEGRPEGSEHAMDQPGVLRLDSLMMMVQVGLFEGVKLQGPLGPKWGSVQGRQARRGIGSCCVASQPYIAPTLTAAPAFPPSSTSASASRTAGCRRSTSSAKRCGQGSRRTARPEPTAHSGQAHSFPPAQP